MIAKIKRRAKSIRLHQEHRPQRTTIDCCEFARLSKCHTSRRWTSTDELTRTAFGTRCHIGSLSTTPVPAALVAHRLQPRTAPQSRSTVLVQITDVDLLSTNLRTTKGSNSGCSFRFMLIWRIEGYRISRQQVTRSARSITKRQTTSQVFRRRSE